MQLHTLGDLTVEVAESPGAIRIELRGKSGERSPEQFLGPLFRDLARRAQGGHLELHFEQLSYFNSSTMGAFIGFLQQLKAQRPRPTVVLSYDGSSNLQRVSLEALRIFDAPGGFLKLTPVTAARG
jgi:hypothetical protein